MDDHTRSQMLIPGDNNSIIRQRCKPHGPKNSDRVT